MFLYREYIIYGMIAINQCRGDINMKYNLSKN